MENNASPRFVGGTLIQTDKGYIPINKVQVGDKVLTHRQRYRTVTNIESSLCGDLWLIIGKWFSTITCAANQPFLAKPRLNGLSTWIEGKDLTPKTYIALVPSVLSISKMEIKPRERVRFDEDGIMWYAPTEVEPLENVSAIMFSLQVEEDNSYTANGVIVKN